MAERSLVDYTLKGMKRLWQWPVKHADGATLGIADLSAWIAPAGNVFVELKDIDAWPKRADTPVTFGVSEEQRHFIFQRHGWLFCRVRNEYLLFSFADTFFVIDTKSATRRMLENMAERHWFKQVNWMEFAACISRLER